MVMRASGPMTSRMRTAHRGVTTGEASIVSAVGERVSRRPMESPLLLEKRRAAGEAEHHPSLASRGIPRGVEASVPTEKGCRSKNLSSNHRADSTDGDREQDVGRRAHPWRALEAGHPGLQENDPTPCSRRSAAGRRARLAHASEKPHRGDPRRSHTCAERILDGPAVAGGDAISAVVHSSSSGITTTSSARGSIASQRVLALAS